MPADGPVNDIAIAVVRRDDRYLIGQRSSDGPLPGYWEFPGGKVQASEAPADAAVRECLEETGLAVRVLGTLAEVEHDYPHGRLRLYFFLCAAVDAAAAASPRFRWVEGRDLPQYAFPAANRQVVARLAGGAHGR